MLVFLNATIVMRIIVFITIGLSRGKIFISAVIIVFINMNNIAYNPNTTAPAGPPCGLLIHDPHRVKKCIRSPQSAHVWAWQTEQRCGQWEMGPHQGGVHTALQQEPAVWALLCHSFIGWRGKGPCYFAFAWNVLNVLVILCWPGSSYCCFICFYNSLGSFWYLYYFYFYF